MSQPTMTLRLHAPLDAEFARPELRHELVQVTVNGKPYTARVTNVRLEGETNEAMHADVSMWMEERAECEDQDHAGPTGPVLFTLDELGQSVTAAEREAARAAR